MKQTDNYNPREISINPKLEVTHVVKFTAEKLEMSDIRALAENAEIPDRAVVKVSKNGGVGNYRDYSPVTYTVEVTWVG